MWLPTEVFLLAKSLHKVTLQTVDSSLTLKARTQVSTPPTLTVLYISSWNKNFYCQYKLCKWRRNKQIIWFFPHLLTDIICPLIVKRVFTGDVCTALISSVLAGGGHAKAWPSSTLSFGTSVSGLVFKILDLLVMTIAFKSFLIMEFMSMTVDPTFKVSFFVMSYNVPFAAIDWSAKPTVTDSSVSVLDNLSFFLLRQCCMEHWNVLLFRRFHEVSSSIIIIKFKNMIYCNYSDGNIETEIKKIIFTLNIKFLWSEKQVF